MYFESLVLVGLIYKNDFFSNVMVRKDWQRWITLYHDGQIALKKRKESESGPFPAATSSYTANEGKESSWFLRYTPLSFFTSPSHAKHTIQCSAQGGVGLTAVIGCEHMADHARSIISRPRIYLSRVALTKVCSGRVLQHKDGSACWHPVLYIIIYGI